MSDSKTVIRTLRAMAWERAKGELNSMRHTFWGFTEDEQKFSELDLKIEEFIKNIEDDELYV